MELKISNDKFDVIGIHDWPDIFKKIEAKFVVKKNTNTRFNWYQKNMTDSWLKTITDF